MRQIINYIRSCFCKHEWELLEDVRLYCDRNWSGHKIEPYFVGKKWFYRCKKCGYGKEYNMKS